jgi:hypothetical protein
MHGPDGYWRSADHLEALHAEYKRQQAEPPPVGNDAIFAHAIIAFGVLMMIAAYVTGVLG